MWETIAIGVAICWGGFAIVQGVIVAVYLRHMRPNARPTEFSETESCAVLMAVRGADPSLRPAIQSVLKQQGVPFHLHLIVDSLNDSAVPVIQTTQLEFLDHATLHCTSIDRDSCSLKCLGLSQVVRKLLTSDSPPKYFAFVDADGEVSRDWLLRLLTPIRESTASADSSRIGATTGHRWYTCFPREGKSQRRPEEQATHSLGAMVRYFWNLGSLPQMALYQIVWGGSWAISADCLRDSRLVESWEAALFEDTQVAEWVKHTGAKTVVAPGLLVRSYEPVSIVDAGNWIQRQLLDLRLYHRCFPLVLSHAGLLAGLHIATISLLFLCLASGQWLSIAILLAAAFVFQLVYCLIWWGLERTATTCLNELDFGDTPAEAKNDPNRVSQSNVFLNFPAWWCLVLTQISYPLAAFRTLFVRKVFWRGIEYRVHSPYNIKRFNYSVSEIGNSHESNLEQQ